MVDGIPCSTKVSGLENSVFASSHCFRLILKGNLTAEPLMAPFMLTSTVHGQFQHCIEPTAWKGHTSSWGL